LTTLLTVDVQSKGVWDKAPDGTALISGDAQIRPKFQNEGGYTVGSGTFFWT